MTIQTMVCPTNLTTGLHKVIKTGIMYALGGVPWD